AAHRPPVPWHGALAGCAPGFGRLAGYAELFAVPPRSPPRTRVPLGAVALAGEFTGVSPRSSPGGWQLIGRTQARLWDLDRQPPALFVPGTIVRFVEAERESVDLGSSSAADDAAAGAGTAAESNAQETSGTATSEAGHALEVLRPGLQLLIEDLGRPGYNSMGVSGAGAADRTALERGNRLVGNAESAAGLESFGGGALLRVTGDGVAAVTGAAG